MSDNHTPVSNENPQSPMIQPVDSTPPLYPSFLRRGLGVFVDSLVPALLSALLAGALHYLGAFDRLASTDLSRIFPGAESWSEAVMIISWVIAWMVHRIWAEMKTGTSLGKSMTGVKVTMMDGGRVTFVAALVRNSWALLTLGSLFSDDLGDSLRSTAIFILGVSILASSRNQSLLDKLAGTIVVNQVPVGRPNHQAHRAHSNS